MEAEGSGHRLEMFIKTTVGYFVFLEVYFENVEV